MASDKLRGEMGKEEKEDEMDMSPMIDMVFLLLIFFIVVSTPMVVTQDPEVAPSVAYNGSSMGHHPMHHWVSRWNALAQPLLEA